MNFETQTIPILLSLIGIISLFLVRKKVSKNTYSFNFWVSGIVFFSVYAFLILATLALDAYYWAEYNSLDVNDEGYIEAQNNVVKDTSRNFVFITGIFISMLISFNVFVVGFIGTFIKRKRLKNNSQQRI